MFLIYIHKKFHIPKGNPPLVVPVIPKHNWAYVVTLFFSLQKWLNKVTCSRKISYTRNSWTLREVALESLPLHKFARQVCWYYRW